MIRPEHTGSFQTFFRQNFMASYNEYGLMDAAWHPGSALFRAAIEVLCWSWSLSYRYLLWLILPRDIFLSDWCYIQWSYVDWGSVSRDNWVVEELECPSLVDSPPFHLAFEGSVRFLLPWYQVFVPPLSSPISPNVQPSDNRLKSNQMRLKRKGNGGRGN